MPRKPRAYLAGVPCHIIQRGNNRDTCFYSVSDYLFYLDCLHNACIRYRVALHAYVLMTNHVHLLMTPDTAEGISQVMQSLGRRYVQYINYKRCRSGTLWEGRHKASLVDAEAYLLTCMRYIELNPVRANMVKHPADYRWSSHRSNALGKDSPLITPHACYLALSHNAERRLQTYRGLFEERLHSRDIHRIRNATQFCMPLGNEQFKQHVEATLSRPMGFAKRGRPGVNEEAAHYS